MNIRNGIAWHAGKTACTKHAPVCVCAASQAPCAAGPEATSASRAPHAHAGALGGLEQNGAVGMENAKREEVGESVGLPDIPADK